MPAAQTLRTAPRRAGRPARGQALTEVLVVAGLLAIGSLMAATSFGDTLRGVFGGSSDALAGDGASGGSGDGALQRRVNRAGKKNLNDFAQSDAYAPALNMPNGATGGSQPTPSSFGGGSALPLGKLGGLGSATQVDY